MTIIAFIEKLRKEPKAITFRETIQVIEDHYTFVPTSFTNGKITNQSGENSGSCKLFSFGKLNRLSVQETLFCFGNYYTNVVNTPKGDDHQNIRNFMNTGWEGVSFEKKALSKK